MQQPRRSEVDPKQTANVAVQLTQSRPRTSQYIARAQHRAALHARLHGIRPGRRRIRGAPSGNCLLSGHLSQKTRARSTSPRRMPRSGFPSARRRRPWKRSNVGRSCRRLTAKAWWATTARSRSRACRASGCVRLSLAFGALKPDDKVSFAVRPRLDLVIEHDGKNCAGFERRPPRGARRRKA